MRKIIAVCICITVIATSQLSSFAASGAYTKEAEKSGIASGTYANTLTRGEAVNLLYNTLGNNDRNENIISFTDVSEDYAAAVGWAVKNGVVKGVSGTRFATSSAVTLQELIVMLYRLSGSPEVYGTELREYNDGVNLPVWSESAVLWGIKTGIIVPSDGKLKLKSTVSGKTFNEMLSSFEQLPDTGMLKKDLETVSSEHRPIGSQGEKAAAEYLNSRFTGMGYKVTMQAYTDDEGKTGTNVIASRQAKSDNADILVISAHHDSVPAAYGANDDASGVTALLAVAEALKEIPDNIELRFISFTDEENGKNGSRYYTSTLSEAERERIIGDIQIDMLGGFGASGLSVNTMDGDSNWLSDIILAEDSSLSLGAESASDHAAFQLAGIPAVLLTQTGRGYLYHSAADTAQHIDLYSLSRAVSLTASVVKYITSNDTDEYRAVARQQGDGYVYTQRRQNTIYFGSSRADNEAYIGAAGSLTDTRVDKGEYWEDTYDTYKYSMKWFGSAQPMNTYYIYRNDYLESIEIRPAETGCTAEQVRKLLRNMYGEPTDTSTYDDGVLHESWEDQVYSKYISVDMSEPCLVTINNYSLGISNVLASYPVKNGDVNINDSKNAAVWEYVCSIIPSDLRMKIAEFNLFTDGCGNVLAYTSTMDKEDGSDDNSRFSLNIDYYDVYDENGNKRDWSKLTFTVLHEFGHVLLEDDTQIDLSISENTHDPVGFIEGSFRKKYYDSFWKNAEESGVNDYDKDPTRFVSLYAANYFHEDIAETFALFVLSDKPQGDTVAEQKIRSFWNDAEMVRVRNEIRNNMGI